MMANTNTATRVIEPYERGFIAARMGMSEDCNPYRPGSDEHDDWLAGFADFIHDEDIDDD
jgi:hypothetical protein